MTDILGERLKPLSNYLHAHTHTYEKYPAHLIEIIGCTYHYLLNLEPSLTDVSTTETDTDREMGKVRSQKLFSVEELQQ